MEENQVKRTVKKKFLMADKFGRAVKEAGGYVAAIGLGVLATVAKEGISTKADEDDNNEDD